MSEPKGYYHRPAYLLDTAMLFLIIKDGKLSFKRYPMSMTKLITQPEYHELEGLELVEDAGQFELMIGIMCSPESIKHTEAAMVQMYGGSK